MSLRPPGRELDDLVGPGQRLGHDAVRVVIAAQEVGRDAAVGQTRQLPIEEETDRGVLPIAVENVAGDHRERDLLLQRLRDEVFESQAARLRESGCDVVILLRKAEQRAAEVQIGGVQESEVHCRPIGVTAIRREARGQGQPRNPQEIASRPKQRSLRR